MKIRNGFVSNSSTSSFLIYGGEIEFTDELIEKMNLTEEEQKQYEEERDDWFLGELICEKVNLDYFSAYNGEVSYLGSSWDSVGDDETGKQFKENIEMEFKKLLGEETKCSTISAAWGDY